MANTQVIRWAKAKTGPGGKVYPRLTGGRFNTIRVAFVVLTQLVFFGLPWLEWGSRQAVLFDMVEQRIYLFGLVLMPQDLVYLAALLIACALGLFAWTTLAGRLWCGNACPQTVYSEIMLWIERGVEGDRMARMKLDAGPMTARKLGLKLLKHGLMITFSLWVGFTFVAWFTPLRPLLAAGSLAEFGYWTLAWLLMYAAFTYVLAGLAREKVCQHMCPYARFQGVMFDPDTLIVSYDAARGEPRKGQTGAAAAKSSCIDCGICVQVCPVGIDIRDGLQYECIGCAACIDACDAVMDKVGAPRGLIRFSTQNAMQGQIAARPVWRRPRVLVYSVLFASIGVGMTAGLLNHSPYKLNVLRDRAFLVRETDDGWLENGYQLRVINASETAQRFELAVEGLPQARITMENPSIDVGPNAVATVYARVQAAGEGLARGSHPLHFILRPAGQSGAKVSEKASFLAD